MAAKQTIVNADLAYVKTQLDVSLATTKRARTQAAAKFGLGHPVTNGYDEEYKKLNDIIENLKEA